MKAKVAEKPKKKAGPLDGDVRIIAETLKGEAEIRAVLESGSETQMSS